MNRKTSSVASLTTPVTGANRRMSVAKGLAVPNDGSRRASNVAGSRPSLSTGPSLVGLFASKRLARNLATRFFNRRGGSRFGSSRLSSQLHIQKEPSYRMEPYRKFSPAKVQAIIQEVLDEKLEKFKYIPKICANFTKILADEIKEKVKLLHFDRYRIVCDVLIGNKNGQGLMTSSRCMWDDNLDNYATYTFQNRFIFCTATVYAVYTE